MTNSGRRPFSHSERRKIRMVKSMYAAVAGLRTHQAKMDVIGNNIANINTFGFKKARASFRDQFYQTMRGSSEADALYGGGNPNQVGYGVSLSSIEVDFGTASGAPTGNGMDAMIAGNGFFMVGTFATAGYDVTSLSAGQNLSALNYTRVGIFYTDGQGWLVDPMRNHVYGYAMEYVEVLALEDPTDPTSDYIGTGKYTWQVAGLSKAADPTDPTSGEKLRLEALQVPYALYDSATGKAVLHTQATAQVAADEYNATHTSPPYTAKTYEDYIGKAIQVPFLMNEPDNTEYLTDNEGKIADMRLTGGAVSDILAELGYDPTDPDAPQFFAATMKLTNISIGPDGLVTGVNQDSRENITIGKLILADVPNANALESLGNGYYRAKNNTGVITAAEAGHGSTGLLVPGALEMANVDLAQEFTDMITTQRGFQANGRIITVTDEMLAELVNLKR